MVDEKNDNSPKDVKKPAINTSSPLDKPIVGSNPSDVADIDTSHLSLEESVAEPATTNLENTEEAETLEINTSHLSIDEDNKVTEPASAGDDFDLENSAPETLHSTEQPAAVTTPDENLIIVDNPLAKKSTTEAGNGNSVKKPVENKPLANKHDSEQIMLTTGKSDEKFEQDLETDNEASDSSIEDKNDESTTEGPIESILSTVKKPENIIRNAWANSSLKRFLLENFETYRVKDEDNNMENVIEKVYGGAVEDRFKIKKFIKDNVLFSFLALIFMFLVGWKAAGYLFPDIMPSINDQIIETVQKTTTGKPAAKKAEKKKTVVINQENKEKIEETFSHCLIKPDAHTALTAAFSATGYEFSNRSLTIAYEEILDSIKVWKDMNMGFYVKDAILRFNQLAELSLPVIQDASKSVSQYSNSLQQIRQKADELENRIRNIKTSGGNQSTYTINERIPLRNELDTYKKRLLEEPEQERFAKLLSKLTLAEETLTGKVKPVWLKTDEISEKDPAWLLTIPDTAATEIAKPINEIVLPTIQTPANKLNNVSPKLTAFHLSELETSIDNLLKLSALITYLPENRLIPYKLELSGLTRRLNRLMNKELPEWANFNSCLSAVREQAIDTAK